MDDSQLIAEIRAFTRFYTPLVGALDAGHLKTPYSLAEARVIYELAQSAGASHGQLARALKLDPGYLSRIYFRLVDLGLVAVLPHSTDRRSNRRALTAEGRAAYETLNAASNELVSELVKSLDAGQKRELGRAIRAIRAILGDEMARGPVILRPQRLGELGWLIHRQALLYSEQFGWNAEFEGLIARIYAEYQSAPEQPAKHLWVAAQDDAIVGSIFVMPSDGIPGSAQLRMLYVEPAARGQGIGAALVRQGVDFARAGGYERMRLWTHANQESARRLYAAAGFAIVEVMRERNFGKDLTGEIWEMVF